MGRNTHAPHRALQRHRRKIDALASESGIAAKSCHRQRSGSCPKRSGGVLETLKAFQVRSWTSWGSAKSAPGASQARLLLSLGRPGGALKRPCNDSDRPKRSKTDFASIFRRILVDLGSMLRRFLVRSSSLLTLCAAPQDNLPTTRHKTPAS